MLTTRLSFHGYASPARTLNEGSMQRFKPSDPVFIIPKFAHLYPDHSALVIDAKENPFRPMFNQYTLEFADRSTAKLLEFQIIEDVPRCDTVIASVAFDS